MSTRPATECVALDPREKYPCERREPNVCNASWFSHSSRGCSLCTCPGYVGAPPPHLGFNLEKPFTQAQFEAVRESIRSSVASGRVVLDTLDERMGEFGGTPPTHDLRLRESLEPWLEWHTAVLASMDADGLDYVLPPVPPVPSDIADLSARLSRGEGWQ